MSPIIGENVVINYIEQTIKKRAIIQPCLIARLIENSLSTMVCLERLIGQNDCPARRGVAFYGSGAVVRVKKVCQ